MRRPENSRNLARGSSCLLSYWIICPHKLGGCCSGIPPQMHFTQKNSKTGDWQASLNERQATVKVTEGELSVSGVGRHFPRHIIPEVKDSLARAQLRQMPAAKSHA